MAIRVDGVASKSKLAVTKITVIMPAYNAARTVASTIAGVPDSVAEIIVVDDCSKDETVAIARTLPVRTIALEHNVGYGGNQKVCYREALAGGADIVVMVHPDGQYDPTLVPQMVAPIANGQADLVLGSRMLTVGGARAGGMPLYRYVFNRLLTRIENWMWGQTLTDAHTGYRAYSRAFLEAIPFERNNDDFVFDTQVLTQAVAFAQRVVEIPIPTRYHDAASSTSMKANLVYGLGTLVTVFRFRLHRLGLTSHLFS